MTTPSTMTPERCTMAAVAKQQRRLFIEDIALLTGLSAKTLTSYKAKGRMPEPDDQVLEKGHVRPWWYEATVKEWLAGRRGRGWRKGETSS